MIHHAVLAIPLPILAAGLGAIGSIGGAIGGLLNKPKPPPVPNVPGPPPPVQQPQGNQQTNAPAGTPSFLSAAAAPQSTNTPGKTLLGQ